MTPQVPLDDRGGPGAGQAPSTPEAGRRAVVTGASRGLGLEWTRQLLATGWSVIAAVRQPGSSDRLGELAAGAPGRLAVEAFDATGSRGDMDGFAARVGARWDGLDLLVNNAGISHAGPERSASSGPLASIDTEALASVLGTNVVGPVALTAALAPLLAAAGGGMVVNVSSRLGSIEVASGPDDPYQTDYAYRISKAAINMATALLAGELAKQRTTVVALSPGFVSTDLTGHHPAAIGVEESVSGQLATIGKLGPADTGKFLGHTGASIPW